VQYFVVSDQIHVASPRNISKEVGWLNIFEWLSLGDIGGHVVEKAQVAKSRAKSFLKCVFASDLKHKEEKCLDHHFTV
jgi:hypothetical protein